eukprot:8571469-Pyramimonas_sp.AAC.1
MSVSSPKDDSRVQVLREPRRAHDERPFPHDIVMRAGLTCCTSGGIRWYGQSPPPGSITPAAHPRAGRGCQESEQPRARTKKQVGARLASEPNQTARTTAWWRNEMGCTG